MEVGRRKSVWLDLPPRMTARRLASGKVLYYYQARGKKIPLGANRITANEQWARLEASGPTMLFPAVAKLYRSSTFAGFAVSTKEHYETALRNLEDYLRKFRLEQVEPRHVKAYIRKRSKKGAALFEKRVLSAVFNWARGEGITSAPNPCHGMKLSKTEKRVYGSQPRPYVTDAQFDEVHARGDVILQDAMDLALLTGQRPGDILNARRQDIVEGVLWFTQQKTGKRVGIKVQGALAGVLERILGRGREVPSMYLIADRHGQRVRLNALGERFRKARVDATWQFRDIRAKAGTDSPDLKRAQELLGHEDEATTAAHYRRSRGAVVEPLERRK